MIVEDAIPDHNYFGMQMEYSIKNTVIGFVEFFLEKDSKFGDIFNRIINAFN
jgi:hypothetical protein